MTEEKKKISLTERLRQKYRLVILNDSSFEEKFSWRLTPGGILILVSAITIIMSFLVISLIAFTPFREYIPGYGDVSNQKELIRLSVKVDSMEYLMDAKNWYIDNLNNVLNGNISPDDKKLDRDSSKKYQNINVKPSKNDSDLRKEIESQDKFSLTLGNKNAGGISGYFFFSPVKGMITQSFNMAAGHYGVDVAAKENEFIKAALDGTVVFAGWTANDGYVIQLQHGNNLMSVYKHNSDLAKNVGDHVKAGEPIAIIGSTGESSTGTHLHFELWYNGTPVNPQDYVLF
ncbi:MAG TPA: M23 family metallopeptidase [Bacteroidia bacterium]|jgi:murein DD-endopeptidase MepM/ murein hydrolase activator NlpD|nr:M23 family metallopeptidase [Bacteroidia bacterium]